VPVQGTSISTASIGLIAGFLASPTKGSRFTLSRRR
jgi:hypothetical protein